MRLPESVHVLVRGWMHGNVVVLRGAAPALIDTGYHTGVDDVCAAFLAHVGAPVDTHLERIALTHTHSDHGGGAAALQARSQAPVTAHPDTARMVNDWDTEAMWLDETGQQMPRYRVDQTIEPGETLVLGDRAWEVVWTPGHATGGIAFFDPTDGILVTGDALWENGFGILNPWTDGPQVFDDAARALDHIAETRARIIIPGHGSPFSGLSVAVDRARSRLDYLHRNPARLQVLVVRSCVGFLRMARPDISAVQVRQITEEMVRGFGLPEGAVAERVAEVLGGVTAAGPRG